MNAPSQRPAGITVLVTLLGLAALSALAAGVPLVQEAISIASQLEEVEEPEMAYFQAVLNVFGALAFEGLCGGLAALAIYLWKLRPWARKITLALMVLLAAFFGSLTLLSLAVVDLRGLLLRLPPPALAGWAIWFLKRPEIKALFQPPPAGTTSPPAAAG